MNADVPSLSLCLSLCLCLSLPFSFCLNLIDEFYEMSHSREIKLSFSMDDDHILALFRKAAHLSDPEEAIDVDSFITVLMHDPEIAQALANSPMKDIDEHSTQVASPQRSKN